MQALGFGTLASSVGGAVIGPVIMNRVWDRPVAPTGVEGGVATVGDLVAKYG